MINISFKKRCNEINKAGTVAVEGIPQSGIEL